MGRACGAGRARPPHSRRLRSSPYAACGDPSTSSSVRSRGVAHSGRGLVQQGRDLAVWRGGKPSYQKPIATRFGGSSTHTTSSTSPASCATELGAATGTARITRAAPRPRSERAAACAVCPVARPSSTMIAVRPATGSGGRSRREAGSGARYLASRSASSRSARQTASEAAPARRPAPAPPPGRAPRLPPPPAPRSRTPGSAARRSCARPRGPAARPARAPPPRPLAPPRAGIPQTTGRADRRCSRDRQAAAGAVAVSEPALRTHRPTVRRVEAAIQCAAPRLGRGGRARKRRSTATGSGVAWSAARATRSPQRGRQHARIRLRDRRRGLGRLRARGAPQRGSRRAAWR